MASDSRLNVSFTAPRPRTGLESSATRSFFDSRPASRAAFTLASKASPSLAWSVNRARNAWNVLLANGALIDSGSKSSATFHRRSKRHLSTVSASETPSWACRRRARHSTDGGTEGRPLSGQYIAANLSSGKCFGPSEAKRL